MKSLRACRHMLRHSKESRKRAELALQCEDTGKLPFWNKTNVSVGSLKTEPHQATGQVCAVAQAMWGGAQWHVCLVRTGHTGQAGMVNFLLTPSAYRALPEAAN